MQEIYKAMIEFQKELKPVLKGSEAEIRSAGKPGFSYTYAKLEEIIEHVTPILNKHDMGFTQTSRIEGMDNVLQTIIFHKSGEKILSEMFLPVASDAQKTGAAITYFKRYMLQAALGLATEDDDAQDVKDIKPLKGKQEQAFQGKSLAQTAEDRIKIEDSIMDFLSTKTEGWDKNDKLQFLKKHFHANAIADLKTRSNDELKRLLSNAMNDVKSVKDVKFEVPF
jgi:hypothetical protein